LIELPQLERFPDLLALFEFVLVAVLAAFGTRGCLHGCHGSVPLRLNI